MGTETNLCCSYLFYIGFSCVLVVLLITFYCCKVRTYHLADLINILTTDPVIVQNPPKSPKHLTAKDCQGLTAITTKDTVTHKSRPKKKKKCKTVQKDATIGD